MKIVGLCGGSGSGKRMVGTHICALGYPYIDTDEVYHDLTSHMSPCLEELVLNFGFEILSGTSLNRAILRDIVFSDKEKLALLNSITHKYILEHTMRLLDEYKAGNNEMAFIDAPVLFESGFDKLCSVIVCVVADKDIRINRIIERDRISRDAAIKRINSQIDDKKLIELSDFCIYNNGSIDELNKNVEEIINLITK